jgi:hypothetical protein
MELILIVILGLVVVMVIGFVVRKVGGGNDPESPNPERADHSATGTEDPDAPDIPPYPTGSGPGGPGAEAMNASQAGSPSPGPSDDEGTADAVKPSEGGRKPLDPDG